MDNQTCIDCNQVKNRATDFYWPKNGINPMKRCKICHNTLRYKDRVKKHNLGFIGLENALKDRIKDLYKDVIEKRTPMTRIITQLQTEYPDHHFTYGMVQQWHKKNQIV